MFKNSHLRLLMTLSDFKLLGPASEETPESPWMISSDVTADDLKDSLHYINQAEFSPPTFEEGVLAENQLKRKTTPRKKAVFDDDEEGEPDDGLFPAGGPTARKVIDEEKRPKKTRKRRRRGSDAEEKARKRREKDAKKNRGIKSALLVREGDDEFDSDEDRVFYAKEREIKEKAAAAANAAHVCIHRCTNTLFGSLNLHFYVLLNMVPVIHFFHPKQGHPRSIHACDI
ncbi:replication fork protection complex subunit tof1 swi1 [Ilyonectria robusta]